MNQFNVGEYISVEKGHSSLTEGTIIKVTIFNPNQCYQGTIEDNAGGGYNVGQAVNFDPRYCKVLTRAARADLLDASADKLNKDAEAKRMEAKRLRDYASDEEELAALLISIQDSKGTMKERITKLATLLRGRIKTNHL